jgi:hypothetical protein
MQITKHIHAIKIPFQIAVSPGKKVDRFVYVYLIIAKRYISLIPALPLLRRSSSIISGRPEEILKIFR